MQTVKASISKTLAEAAASLAGAEVLSEEALCAMLEYPPDPAMGDLALPCFKLSKTLRKAPPVIAAALAASFEGAPLLKKVEVAGGYLNFFVDPAANAGQVIDEILEKGDDYGRSDEGKGKVVVLDYSSPNVAKPFHIGHLGTTVIGHSLKMLYQRLGYTCIGINHLGDWGTQFGKLIVAYRLWGSKETIEKEGVDALVSLYVKINNEIAAEQEASLAALPEEVKAGKTAEELNAYKKSALGDASRAEFHKLEEGNEENLALWKWFKEISLAEYQKTYELLGITFDSYNGEAFYTDKMPAQVEKLREMNLLKLDDGASIVDLSEYKMPPCLILKRDGSTLYPTRDIAAANYRAETYHFDKAVYVTSNQQCLHFAQWFKVCELMGYEWADRLIHVPYGTVSVNGAKLATRTGNVVLLRDLFATAIDKVRDIMEVKNPGLENKDEVAKAVGVGAIVFHYLSNSRIKDSNFVMEDALNFDGNTGPYAQYTYARTCSLIEKAGGAIPAKPEGYVPNEVEQQLVKTLSLFSEKIHDALRDHEPMVITRYILDICASFNRFYHECQILSAPEEDARAFRLRLTAAAKTVLGSAFGLICMKKTEKI